MGANGGKWWSQWACQGQVQLCTGVWYAPVSQGNEVTLPSWKGSWQNKGHHRDASVPVSVKSIPTSAGSYTTYMIFFDFFLPAEGPLVRIRSSIPCPSSSSKGAGYQWIHHDKSGSVPSVPTVEGGMTKFRQYRTRLSTSFFDILFLV